MDFKQNFKPGKKNNRFYVYRVKRGDSLRRIAKRFKISYRLIKDFNHLKSSRLRLKQKLILPVLKPTTISYIIRKGDTMGKISKRFKVAVNKIVKLNHKKNTIIRIGEKIVIPQIN